MNLLLVLAAAVGFQGVELGITEEQLRARIPSLGCSGAEMPLLRVSPEQAAAGTKVCAPTEIIGSSVVPQDVSIGAYRGAIRYYVTQGVVARIEFWPDYPASESVLAGLIQKYGKPEEMRRGVTEAVNGRQVASLRAVWRQGDQTIELQAPSANLNKMSVTYTGGIETERVVPANL